MKHLQACLGPKTRLEVKPVKEGYSAVLWAEDDSAPFALVQWAIAIGSTIEVALTGLDLRLTGLTYDDVMRS